MTMQRDAQYIYLLKEREFVKSGEDVYKIGKTCQANLARFANYPKGSVLYYQIICDDCTECENALINMFKIKYIHRNHDIGNEYFQGNYVSMIDDIHCVVMKQCKNIRPNYISVKHVSLVPHIKMYTTGMLNLNAI